MSEESPQNSAPRRRRRGPLGAQRPMTTDVPDGYLVVGRIISAHGIQGEFSVEPYTDFPEERFVTGQTILAGESMTPVKILSAWPHKARWLLQFAEINDREDVEARRGEWLFIREDEAADLEADTYFVHQIMGLRVQDEAGSVLGTVKDVLFTGANEVYIITPAAGVNRDREVLLPAIGEVIQAVDLEAGTMTVRLLPGMLEE